MPEANTPATGQAEVSVAATENFADFKKWRESGELPDEQATAEKTSDAAAEPEKPADDTEAKPAPDSDPEDKQEKTDEGDGEDEKPAAKKGGFQRRIDKLTRDVQAERREKQELAQRLDSLERRLAEPTAAQPASDAKADDAEPQLEEYDTLQKYLNERDAWKDRQRAKAEQQAAVKRENEAWYEKCEKARTKHEDFDDVVTRLTRDLGRISPVVNAVVKESDIGPDIAYYLGSNPAEAKRINALGPVAASRELFKIEAKLAEPQKHTLAPGKTRASTAPEPITPISGVKSGTVSLADPNVPYNAWKTVREAQLRRA